MIQEITQRSLFPVETEFNPDIFKASVLSETFMDCLRDGVLQGLQKTHTKFQEGENSLSLKAHCLHEDVFTSTISQLSEHIPSEDFSFTTNISGNERLHFTYKGYVFIVKLADRTRNDTKQEERIRNQEFGNHVISIVYTLDALRENINTLSLQYIKGQTVVWQHSIPLDSSVDFGNDIVTEVEIVAQKPKLKRNIQKKATL